MNHAPTVSHPLPCVVQLGFAGSRRLFADDPADPTKLARRHTAVEQHLIQQLERLRDELRLESNHFLVGISAMACGADTLFSRACRNMSPQPIPQRILLPQHREQFLSAVGSDGIPDFTADERAEVESLLAESHIVQEMVVSHSADRNARFQETNVEILRVSDVIICLLRHDAAGKPGGTNELLERAKQRGTPVLEIRVGLDNGSLTFDERWHNLDADHPFQLPRLPEELAHESVRIAIEPLPSRAEFCKPLEKLVSKQAAFHQKLFKFAAVTIIATHILATLCATLALSLHEHGSEHGPGPIPLLLVIELLLLGAGFGIHWHLHHSHAARVWALARLVAELARSLRAIGPHHVYLEHLFRLQLPHRFRHLLRTLSALHLRSTWPDRMAAWEPRRDAYLKERVDHQIRFYSDRLPEDERRLRNCQWAFTLCSILAIVATLTKLVCLFQVPDVIESSKETWLVTLGTLAIVLPVLAVGGLSWAAALDCEARVETFGEALSFLKRQRAFLEQATSATEFNRLLLETETTLLGETANWFSRRSNTGVA